MAKWKGLPHRMHKHRKKPNETETDELAEHWEAVLASEGLSMKSLYSKQLRAPRDDELADAIGMGREHRKGRKAIAREIVVSPDQHWVYDQAVPDAAHGPQTALEGLVTALPHHDAPTDLETQENALEALLSALTEILGEPLATMIYRNKVLMVSAVDLAEEVGVQPNTMRERISRGVKRLQTELPEFNERYNYES